VIKFQLTMPIYVQQDVDHEVEAGSFVGGLGGLRPFQDVPMSSGPQSTFGSVSPLFQARNLMGHPHEKI
jgi:hypothetical protein